MRGFPSREQIQRYKEMYPKGTLIQLDHMNDPYPVPAGTVGVVVSVDDGGNVQVRWQNGRTLAVIPEADQFHVAEDGQTEELDMTMNG
ncbi:MAG: DUF4314 domain-containing protein [Oscillospiraceae bacterium]|nr:DUF4314 domain-containing protein [Oscillospiraceae bacterium]